MEWRKFDEKAEGKLPIDKVKEFLLVWIPLTFYFDFDFV